MTRDEAHKFLDDALDAKIRCRIVFDISEREEEGIVHKVEHLSVRSVLLLAKQIQSK